MERRGKSRINYLVKSMTLHLRRIYITPLLLLHKSSDMLLNVCKILQFFFLKLVRNEFTFRLLSCHNLFVKLLLSTGRIKFYIRIFLEYRYFR